MESEKFDMGGLVNRSDGANQHGNSRWNPTKEQITMLENMYQQGVKTPNAEQIQQITAKLLAYGHIEGKNVFYWFQNHKARQRQKQKQENMAYFNHFLQKAHFHHQHQPVFASPCPNVVCGSYYLPQSELGFYQQCPKVIIPSSFKRRAKIEKNSDKAKPYAIPQEYNNFMIQPNNSKNYYDNQETLPLFPLHPTGILHGRNQNSCNAADHNSIKATSSSSSDEIGGRIEDCSNEKPFFDFFSGHGNDN